MENFALRVLVAMGVKNRLPWDAEAPDWLLPDLYPEATDKTMLPLSDIGVVAVEFENSNSEFVSSQKARAWFSDGSSRRINMASLYSDEHKAAVDSAFRPTLLGGTSSTSAEALVGFAKWLHRNHLVLSPSPSQKGMWQFARRGEKNNGRLVSHPDSMVTYPHLARGIEYTTEAVAPGLNFIAGVMAESLMAKMSEEQRSTLAPVIREQKARALRHDIEAGFPQHLRGKALAAIEQMEMREMLASQKTGAATRAATPDEAPSEAPVARKAKAL